MAKPTSIFVGADIHAALEENKLKSVLDLVRKDKDAVKPDNVILGGDLVGIAGGTKVDPEVRAKYWTPAFKLDDLRNEIKEILGRDVGTFFTYGSHDKCEADGGRGFFTGPHDCGGFYIYGISFAQMRFSTEFQRNHIADEKPAPPPIKHDMPKNVGDKKPMMMRSREYDGIDINDPYGASAEIAAERFSAWAESLEDQNPVLVVSHIPLHAHRKDNRGADIWCKALNRAAEKRDVFVFFAHNHTAEKETRLDREYYLVPSGGVMPIQCENADETTNEKILFTYLNAGYIINGCGNLITFFDRDNDGLYDEIKIERYSLSESERDFGDTGIASPYVKHLKRS